MNKKYLVFIILCFIAFISYLFLIRPLLLNTIEAKPGERFLNYYFETEKFSFSFEKNESIFVMENFNGDKVGFDFSRKNQNNIKLFLDFWQQKEEGSKIFLLPKFSCKFLKIQARILENEILSAYKNINDFIFTDQGNIEFLTEVSCLKEV